MDIDRILGLKPISPHIGADVTAVTVAQILADDDMQVAFKMAIAKCIALRFRGQEVAPGDMEKFMGLMGPVMDLRVSKDNLHVPGHDGIQVLSNGISESGKPYGDDNSSGQIWHTDAAQWEVPPGAVILYGRVVPKDPPKTHFKNMIKVYADLPQATRDRIAPLRVIHHIYPRSVDVNVHRNGPSLPREERETGQLQPLVRRHLPSGLPVLYLPTRRDSVIPGLSDEEARTLLTDLWDFTDSCDYCFAEAIQKNDLVIWDNVASVHSRDGWSPSERRDVWHLVAEGEAATPMFPRKQANKNAPVRQAAI